MFALASCQYDGQVTVVKDVTDMNLYPLTIGDSPNTDKYRAIGPNPATPQGQLSASIAGFLQSWKTYPMPEDEEFHFMVTASYQSVGLVNGPSGNPYEGVLRFGLSKFQGVGFSWIITDKKAWVFIHVTRRTATESYERAWFIPVGDLQPDQTIVYEIAVSKKTTCISFSMNRQERYRYCGDQGIDPKFLAYAYPEPVPPGRQPNITSEDFDGEYFNLVNIGRVFNLLEYYFPPCLDATFHICADSTYRAFSTRCAYRPVLPPVPGQYYTAQLDQIQIFHVNKTKRCEGYSDSSTCQIGYLGRCSRYYDLK